MTTKPSPKTYVVTGEWSGPRSPAGDYTRIVHREYVRDDSKSRRNYLANLRKLGHINYSDGTTLFINVDEVPPRTKRLPEIHGYNKLIRDCISYGVNSVDALEKAQSAGGAA